MWRSGPDASRTMRHWLPYAGITRIRFEGFSRGSSQCANAHPQPDMTIRLPPRTVKNPRNGSIANSRCSLLRIERILRPRWGSDQWTRVLNRPHYQKIAKRDSRNLFATNRTQGIPVSVSLDRKSIVGSDVKVNDTIFFASARVRNR